MSQLSRDIIHAYYDFPARQRRFAHWEISPEVLEALKAEYGSTTARTMMGLPVRARSCNTGFRIVGPPPSFRLARKSRRACTR